MTKPRCGEIAKLRAGYGPCVLPPGHRMYPGVHKDAAGRVWRETRDDVVPPHGEPPMPKKTDPTTPATPTEVPETSKDITLPLAYVLGLEDAANALSDLLMGVNVETAGAAHTALTAIDALGEQLTPEQNELLGLD